MPIKDDRLLLPQKVCALVFSVSFQAIQQWPVKPRKKVGRTQLYYLPDLAAYRDFHGRKQKDYDLTEERARLAAAQADRTELELETARGNLIPAEDVLAAWEPIVGAIRAKVLGIPSKLKTALPKLTERDLQKIKKIVRQTLEDLSKGKK